MTHTNQVNLTIREAAAQIERSALSPVELTDAMLQRIAHVDKTLNAYITVCDEQAREVALAAEKMIRAGYHLGPLHGIPIAIKDNIYTRGVRTTAGSKILADFVPQEDAAVTARLKRAGAVIIGKTNLHEFAWGGTTDNPHYGSCRNPWNPERFPAGSSGGPGGAEDARVAWRRDRRDRHAVHPGQYLRPAHDRVVRAKHLPPGMAPHAGGRLWRRRPHAARARRDVPGHALPAGATLPECAPQGIRRGLQACRRLRHPHPA